MEKDWHSSHFCCWQCDESLTGQRYVLRDDHPYCIKCYENVFANTCEECNKIIGIDSKVRDERFRCFYIELSFTNFPFKLQDLSYKEKHWHEACFLCNKCRVSLVDKQFGSKADKIYCGNCYDSQFASRCDGCSEIFRAGELQFLKFNAAKQFENLLFKSLTSNVSLCSRTFLSTVSSKILKNVRLIGFSLSY